jgi:hypothetical protein
MKCIKIAGLCLVCIVSIGMAAPVASSATPVWEICTEGGSATKYSEDNCVSAEGSGKWEWNEIKNTEKVVGTDLTLTLVDTKTSVGRSGALCAAGGEEAGIAGPGSMGKITSFKVSSPKTNCRGVGGCTEVEAVEGIHLPWLTKLSEKEGEVFETVENAGSGEPGWKVQCNTALGKETDECEAGQPPDLEEMNIYTIIRRENLTLSYFRPYKWKCTLGGAESGEFVGHRARLSFRAAGLRVS